MRFCDRCFEKIKDNFIRATSESECFEFCDMDCFQEFANLNDLEGCILEFVVLDDEEEKC